MKEFIKKIRKKPEHVRIKFSIFFATLFTMIIVVIWLTAIRDNTVFLNKEKIENIEEITKENKPLNLLKNKFLDIFDDSKDLVSEIGNPFSGIEDSLIEAEDEKEKDLGDSLQEVELEEDILYDESNPFSESETDIIEIEDSLPDNLEDLGEEFEVLDGE